MLDPGLQSLIAFVIVYVAIFMAVINTRKIRQRYDNNRTDKR